MLVAIAACALAALAWAYLLTCHGGFWLTGQRLPGPYPDPAPWPAVTAVVPARDEADALPLSLPTLLSQSYPGEFSVVLVDDQSADGTAAVAAALGREAGWTVSAASSSPALSKSELAGPASTEPGSAQPGSAQPGSAERVLRIVGGSDPPGGWAGKVWAMSQGMAAAGDADYLLFTDADIAYHGGAVTDLVRAAAGGRRALVSQMALLRADTSWERVLVPAFVYFFAQLYPFRRVNRPGRTAAAAGGCMLVRRDVLTAAGGLAAIGGARIDDVALGRLLKRGAGAACWLGLTTDVVSMRPYENLADIWDMIARSAYTQLRYSPAALTGTILGLLWLYLLPPVAAITGLAAGALGSRALAGWLAATGIAGWAMMAVSFLPMLRLYRLSPLRGLSLPLIALLYVAMTADSARRHRAGRGGLWKGRVIQPGGPASAAAPRPPRPGSPQPARTEPPPPGPR